MIAATSAVALTTRVLPSWLAWAGFVVARVALTRYVGPWGGWLALLRIAVVSVLMVVGSVGPTVRARGS